MDDGRPRTVIQNWVRFKYLTRRMNSRQQLQNRPAPVSPKSAKADFATVAADLSAVLLKQMKYTLQN